MFRSKKEGMPRPGEIWRYREGMTVRVAKVEGRGQGAAVHCELIAEGGGPDSPMRARVIVYPGTLMHRIDVE